MRDEHTHDAGSSDLREFLRPIWRRKWLILIVVAVTTGATYAFNERKPDEYTASTQIFLQASEVDALLGAGTSVPGDRNLVNQANLIRTPAVAREVADRIGSRGNPETLLESIRVKPSEGSDFLAVTATQGTPQAAARLANAFATAFIRLRAVTVRGEAESALETARRQLSRLPSTEGNREARQSLRTRISSLEAISALAARGARQVDKAAPPSARSAPQPRRAAIFGFALSFVFAVLAAYGLERLDRRIRHLSQVEPAFHARILAALPRIPRNQLQSANGKAPEIIPAFREVVRGLRANLQLASPDNPLRTLLVTSAVPGEGKSTLVLNLALAYHEAGLRVAVIECDLRRSQLAQAMAVRPTPGLAEVLAGEYELPDAVQVVNVGSPVPDAVEVETQERSGVDRSAGNTGALTVLTSGAQPADPSSLLATGRMKRILETAREVSDVVILDTSPLLAVADTLPLLGLVDGTLVVSRIGATHRSSGRRLKDIIDHIPGAVLLGVVANDVPHSEFGYGYGYGYGYYHGYGDDRKPAAKT